MKHLDHKNIVKVYEVYIDQVSARVYMVMELIKGGELVDMIHKLVQYSEQKAKILFK
jgi:serine/threonine protein kinase